MDLSELISIIQKSGIERANELAKTVTDLFKNKQESHDDEVGKLNSQITNLTEAIGIDSGNSEERLTAASSKISSITSERDTFKTENQKLNEKIAKSERSEVVRKAAEVAGVTTVVLDRLLTDEEVTIIDDKVNIGNQELKVWAETNHAHFMTALYPEAKTPNKLPNTPPHTTQVAEKTTPASKDEMGVAQNYIRKRYKKPDFAI